MDEIPKTRSDSSLSETDRLRDAIDHGKTRDKVEAEDPATSPLGTDDEAAQPHDEEGLKQARRAPPQNKAL